MRKISLVFLLFLSLGLSACSLPGLNKSASKGDFVIAGGNTTERQILAEISKQMLEYHLEDVQTDLVNNLGSSLLVLQSLLGEDANISGAMYSGTSITGELNMEPITDPKQAMEAVVLGYDEEFDFLWLPSYGFENSYAFMVTKSFAQEHQLEKVSDLEKISQEIKAGVDTAWMERKGDGYQDFKKVYGFDFYRVLPMEIGLVYDALAAQEMDLVLGYSTDGRIQAYDLVILEDDRKLFPAYDASPVLSQKLVAKHPEVLEVFLRLEGAIDSETMQSLNRRSDEDKLEPQVVAQEFLEAHAYFKDRPIQSLEERPLYQDIMKKIKKEAS